MTIPPLDIILLLGSGQGFIMATLLWFSRNGNHLSNQLLAGLIGLLALMSLALSVPIPNQWVSLALDLVPLIMVMPLGPLLYFYVKSVLDPAFSVGPTERRHFYPVVLDWGGNLIAWICIGGVLLGFFQGQDSPAWGDVIEEYNTYVDIPRWLSMAVYLVLAKRWLNQYRPVGKDYEAERQRQNVRWLRQFLLILLVFQVIWLVHLVPYIVPATRSALLTKFGWYPVYIPVAILIYWLGLKGYLHVRNSPVDVVTRKIIATSIPAEIVEKAVRSLTAAMQTDKLYLDPELTVEKIGRHTQLPPKTVSFVLNQHLRKSFSTFTNEYRVEAVKGQLTNPANKHLTLTGVAFECGFNSQATFQRTFKQFTGVSPKEYTSQQAAKSRKSPLKSGFE